MNQRVYHKHTIEFITIVKEFVKISEQANEYDAQQMAILLHRILPLLYLKAALLPDFIQSEEDDFVDAVDEHSYNYIQHQYEELFGELDIDITLPDFMVEHQSQSFVSLAEAIADIYQDAKNVLVNYQTGEENIMENALYYCKQNFETFWGQRLLIAANALHHLIYQQKEAFENIKPKKNEDIDSIDSSNWIITKMQHQRKK